MGGVPWNQHSEPSSCLEKLLGGGGTPHSPWATPHLWAYTGWGWSFLVSPCCLSCHLAHHLPTPVLPLPSSRSCSLAGTAVSWWEVSRHLLGPPMAVFTSCWGSKRPERDPPWSLLPTWTPRVLGVRWLTSGPLRAGSLTMAVSFLPEHQSLRLGQRCCVGPPPRGLWMAPSEAQGSLQGWGHQPLGGGSWFVPHSAPAWPASLTTAGDTPASPTPGLDAPLRAGLSLHPPSASPSLSVVTSFSYITGVRTNDSISFTTLVLN